ncbi:MAG: hypothetical protein ACI398_04165 [Clostridium sp.]
MIIPRNVEAKIRHICSNVPNIEWSGVLFYTTEGSLDDGTFKATCQDIYVMDIGDTISTSYKESADIVSYMCNNPELLVDGVYQALIHSHHSMPSFFSGTDINTLNLEGQDTVHFLSLIVNNDGTYTARITRRLDKVVHADYTVKTQYDTYGGNTVVLEDNRTESKDFVKSFIEWFPLNIVKCDIDNPFKDIDSRLKELRDSKRTSLFTPIQKPIVYNKVSLPTNTIINKNNNVPIILNLAYCLIKGTIMIEPLKTNVAWIGQYIKNSIDTEYEKIFGDLNSYDTEESIKDWITNLVDFLMYQSPYIIDYEYNENKKMSESLSKDLITFFKSLDSKSIVLTFIIDILNEYQPENFTKYDR